MDPITSALRRFLAEAEAFFLARPGRALPMIAEPAARGELVKTLRVQELLQSNRRPLFLYEAPFLQAQSFAEGLVKAIEEDYAALRAGVAEEGVSLPPFALAGVAGQDVIQPLAHAARAIERAAGLLGEHFEGIVVALVPSGVEDGAGWRESMLLLSAVRFSAGTRLAIFDPPGGPLKGALGDVGAHFHVDPDALAGYLAGLGADESQGPPQASSAQVTEEEQRLHEATSKLRALLLAAAGRSRNSEFEEAFKHYREARQVCQAAGLGMEEAMVLIALGGIHLAMGRLEASIAHYREAALVAEREGLWPVVAQAWLGVGGACLAARCFEAAADAYDKAADAAKRGELTSLRIEALWLSATCRTVNEAG